MSKQASPTKVGAFVLIGAAILVIAIALLGSARIFSRPVPVILYFRDSVNGLATGSPVKYKGVNIGQVRSITLASMPNSDTLLIPVVIEINEAVFQNDQPKELPLTNPTRLREAVKNGLRGTLETESLVTGRLFVSLDVFQDAEPPVYFGKSDLLEIPTKSTGLVEFIKSLSKVNLPGMATQLNEILTRLNTALGQLQIKELNDRLAGVLERVDLLVGSPKWLETIDSFRQTSDRARDTLATLQLQLPTFGTNLNHTAESASLALGELQRTATDLRRVLAAESPVMSELQSTLEETAQAARAIRLLADDLARNPSALLRGRPPEPQP